MQQQIKIKKPCNRYSQPTLHVANIKHLLNDFANHTYIVFLLHNNCIFPELMEMHNCFEQHFVFAYFHSALPAHIYMYTLELPPFPPSLTFLACLHHTHSLPPETHSKFRGLTMQIALVAATHKFPFACWPRVTKPMQSIIAHVLLKHSHRVFFRSIRK